MSKQCDAAKAVARASTIVSTEAGLDSALMAMQYSAPLAAAALLRLVKRHPALGKHSATLTKVAAGLVAAGGSISAARVINRLVGLIPMINWLLAIHPNPLKALLRAILRPSLSNLNLANERVFATVRIISLCGYYVLEHAVWLASQGVIPMDAERIGTLSVWSVRAWAVDVMIMCAKLLCTYKKLRVRERALNTANPTGSDEKAEVVAARAELAADWFTWETQTIQQYCYLPLTVHWGFGGLWTNPLITPGLSVAIAASKLVAAWTRTA